VGETRAGRRDFLVVEAEGLQAALPLETVVRIERIPRSRIEHAGARPVLRFDGKLLPLDDAAAGHDSGDPEAQTTVVVCRDGERQVGMTVAQVLDVTEGRQLEEAGTGTATEGLTLLRDHVTPVMSLSHIPSLDSAGGAAAEGFAEVTP